MRQTCLNMVYDLAKRDERVVFVGSDLSPGLLADMKRDMPERWYMEGITEQNLIGMSAGLAKEGYIPYSNTIATFITRRCYEQVAVDLCLHDLPVRLIAIPEGALRRSTTRCSTSITSPTPASAPSTSPAPRPTSSGDWLASGACS